MTRILFSWWRSFLRWRRRRRAWRYYLRTGEAGMSLPLSMPWRRLDNRDRAEIMVFLTQDAERFGLPSGTRYEIRIKMPTNFGRNRGIAWYTSRDMREAPAWQRIDYFDGAVPADVAGGYYLVDRRIIP